VKPLDRLPSIRAKLGSVTVIAVGVTILVMTLLLAVVAADPQPAGLTGEAISALRFIRRSWWQLLVAGAIAGATGLLLARLLALGMTRPLREMAAAARRMAQGDYGHRVRVSSRDEVGQLAEAFNRMAREMEGVERLRRELVANVSHELKTPISALRAHLENLLDGVERSDRETLAVMLAQSERLSRLVDELLDLSRLESGEVPLSVEPVLLRPLVEQVIAEVAIARPAHPVEVANDVPPALAPVRADGERLHQVLFNLLDNAVRFTPPGERVGVTAAADGGRVEVSVADTGPGIPEAELSRVFERFYRLDHARNRSDGGTGIGLTIARSLVEAHAGAIWAERGPEGGSVFRFSLPMWEPRPDLRRGLGAGGRDAAGERTSAP
jgi:signal transduction histidine kinase